MGWRLLGLAGWEQTVLLAGVLGVIPWEVSGKGLRGLSHTGLSQFTVLQRGVCHWPPEVIRLLLRNLRPGD